MRELTLEIQGMSCGHCVAAVKKALGGVDGVTVDDVRIGIATVTLNEDRAELAQVTAAVDDVGFVVVATR